MRLEHIALQVSEPAAMADWYVTHLGFGIRRRSDEPAVVRFVADGSGSILFELYHSAKAAVPDYGRMDPAVLHVAVLSADLPADVARLVAAGATLVSGPEAIRGDQFAMLRDPWGLPLQLVLPRPADAGVISRVGRAQRAPPGNRRMRRWWGSLLDPPYHFSTFRSGT